MNLIQKLKRFLNKDKNYNSVNEIAQDIYSKIEKDKQKK